MDHDDLRREDIKAIAELGIHVVYIRKTCEEMSEFMKNAPCAQNNVRLEAVEKEVKEIKDDRKWSLRYAVTSAVGAFISICIALFVFIMTAKIGK
jgi:hypothetical protein